MVALLLAAPLRAEAPAAWELVRDDDGIIVHRRHVEGSTLDELRGAGVVPAPLAAVLAVLQDSDSGEEWMFDCVESTRLAQLAENSYLVYTRTRTPWPLADRDAVVRGKRTFEATQVRIEFEAVDGGRPPVRGVVRMPFVRGHWLLSPEAHDTATRVEYQVHADPGGSLPAWAVNGFAHRLPWETIRGLRAQVARRRYPEVEQALAQRPEYRALVTAP